MAKNGHIMGDFWILLKTGRFLATDATLAFSNTEFMFLFLFY